MEVGIGLPNTVAETRGPEIVEWARAAEEAGFSSLGTIDRIAYPNFEPLISLTAAAAVTERIRLLTSIILSPLRKSVPLFAKQAVSLDNISGGRLVLGLAVGGREDDYQASGVDFHGRGKIFDAQLAAIKDIWAGKTDYAEPLAPDPVTDGGPTLIIGGSVEVAFNRAAKYGAGWMMGGGPPEFFGPAVQQLESAWSEAGREGTPLKKALAYYSLGPDAEANATRSIGRYYSFFGEDGAKMMAGNVLTSPEAIKQQVSAFEAVGCDELVLFPADPGVEQVTLLHEALG